MSAQVHFLFNSTFESDKHFGKDRGENKILKFTTTMNLEESTLATARNMISKISSDCKNPGRAYRAMMIGITARYKLDKAYNRINMIKEMMKYHLVLKSTEKLSKQICSTIKHRPNKNKELSEQVMKWKLQDTYTDLRKIQIEYNETKKNNKEILREEHFGIRMRYSNVFKTTLNNLRIYTRTRTRKKITFLRNRRNEEITTNRNKVTEVEGIRVDNRPLPDTAVPLFYTSVSLIRYLAHTALTLTTAHNLGIHSLIAVTRATWHAS